MLLPTNKPILVTIIKKLLVFHLQGLSLGSPYIIIKWPVFDHSYTGRQLDYKTGRASGPRPSRSSKYSHRRCRCWCSVWPHYSKIIILNHITENVYANFCINFPRKSFKLPFYSYLNENGPARCKDRISETRYTLL